MAYEYSIDDPAKNSKRTLAFILVVIIHALFFWVLASGLGAKIVEVVTGPVETKIIDEAPDEDKPPPPPPEMDTPPPYVPPPEISIEIAADTGPTTAIIERHVRPSGRRARSGCGTGAGREGVRQGTALHAGQGRQDHPARVSAGFPPCGRGGHGDAAGFRAGERPGR